MVALFHIEVGDSAHCSGAQVRIGLWLDLTGSADNRGQILSVDFCGQYLGVTGLLLVDHKGYKPGNYYDGENNQEYLLHVCWLLQVPQCQFTQLSRIKFPTLVKLPLKVHAKLPLSVFPGLMDFAAKT